MEGVSASVYKGLKGYWRAKGYERLNGTGGKRNKIRVVKLASIGENESESGSASASAAPLPSRRRLWRPRRLKLKLKFRFSPRKFMIGLRDAYVNFMMKLANSRAIAGGSGYAGEGVAGFGVRAVKEYDEKMIVEIYKSIVQAQGKLVPRDAAWVSSGIKCRG